jgi:hypothetical protein
MGIILSEEKSILRRGSMNGHEPWGFQAPTLYLQ